MTRLTALRALLAKGTGDGPIIRPPRYTFPDPDPQKLALCRDTPTLAHLSSARAIEDAIRKEALR